MKQTNIVYDDKITYEEMCRLRSLVEWSQMSERQFNIGFAHSLFITVGRVDGKAVSVARVIGDGGYHLAVVDVIVDPEYQRQGIGKTMLSQIIGYADSVTMDGESTMLILVASKGKEQFYKKFGFIERPTDDRGAGMYMYYTRETQGDKENG